MNLGLQEKVVLVTGASKGLGKAIAEAFAAEGSRLALTARNQRELEQIVQEIQQRGGQAIALAADLTNATAVNPLVAETIAHFGTVHVLVNNAGSIGRFPAFEDLSDDDWANLFNLNLFSAVRIPRAVLPAMRKQDWGRIINMESKPAIQPEPAMQATCVSKTA